MDRRTAMKIGAAASLASFLPRGAFAAFTPRPAGWRQFEVTTRIEIATPRAATQVWVPVPSVTEADWMRAGDTTWTTNAANATLTRDPVYGAALVHATWEAGDAPAMLEVISTVSTQDRAADLSAPGTPAPLSEADRGLYTAPTLLIPTDGIVKTTSDEIVAGADRDIDKARRLYDWIVENTARDPEVRGCGLGDVASMLAMGDLTGKCADLNALYVGLARAQGLPARDVYGLRVAPSAFGYKSLGAGSATVTKAQHCRAEVFLEGFGWIAVDPADVRKVMLEEPPKNLSIDDPKVVDARAALFGAWEGNWIAYNFAHDVALPGATQDPVEFLMYPQAEVDGEALDPLDPDAFAYTITAREIA